MPHVLVYFHLMCTSADCNCINQFVHMSCPTCTYMIPRWSCTQTKNLQKRQTETYRVCLSLSLNTETNTKQELLLVAMPTSQQHEKSTHRVTLKFMQNCFAQQPTETYQEYVDLREVMEKFNCSINNIMYVCMNYCLP